MMEAAADERPQFSAACGRVHRVLEGPGVLSVSNGVIVLSAEKLWELATSFNDYVPIPIGDRDRKPFMKQIRTFRVEHRYSVICVQTFLGLLGILLDDDDWDRLLEHSWQGVQSQLCFLLCVISFSFSVLI